MLANEGFVRGDVDAVDLVVGDEALDPLDLRSSTRSTLHDLAEIPCRSAAVSLPAPAISRSMMNFGMSVPDGLGRVQRAEASCTAGADG